MQISAPSFQGTSFSAPSPARPAPADLRRSYALIVLAVFALLSALSIAFNVLHNPAHTDAAIYGLAAFTYLAVALSQRILLPRTGSAALRIRWQLWVGFLLLKSLGLFLTFLIDKNLLHVSPNFKHVCFSLGYALAFIVTVNPPRSTTWRRLWVVDALLACIMAVIFFLVYHYGESAGVYTSLLFAAALQVIFVFGGVLALRTANSAEARDLARYMTTYFVLSSISISMANLPRIWPRLALSQAADTLYATAPAVLALLPLLMQTGFLKRRAAIVRAARPLPPAASVLITCALLLACLPLLHFNVITGIALLVVAVSLFAIKVALMQNDFDHERTSLLQSNKQLRELAYIDPVTGIANRRKFIDVATTALQAAHRGLDPYWIVLVELEDIRRIFASSGRRAGELYLCEFVQLIQPIIDLPTTHFAHIANGEFALLLKRANQQTIETTMQQIRDALHTSRMRVTMGAALATSGGPDSVERWLANAGTMLHRNRAFDLQAAVNS